MMNREDGSWLEAIIVGARDAGWCTSPYCTTCGCLEFRRAYWAAAARQAGVIGRFESARLPRDILAGVTAAERQVLVQHLITGLRELPPMLAETEAVRIIIIDLDPPFLKHGVLMILDEALSGTPVGEVLRRMRTRDAEARARYERRLAYESPQAVEERKRDRRAEKAAAHARRQQEKRQREMKRSEMLGNLAGLSVTDRLSRFATDTTLNLDSVPEELIPTQGFSLLDLDESLVTRLLARIGRRRSTWGRLRFILKSRG